MTTAALWHITVLGWVALGYVLGRLRLRDRLKGWVWDQMTFRTPHAAPWPRQAAVAAALLLTEPRRAYRAYRRRKDPCRPVQAPRFRSPHLRTPDREDRPA